MPDSETEEEILERIETALKKIASIAHAPRPETGPEIDRAALAHSLDLLIARLRAGLEASHSAEPTPE